MSKSRCLSEDFFFAPSGDEKRVWCCHVRTSFLWCHPTLKTMTAPECNIGVVGVAQRFELRDRYVPYICLTHWRRGRHVGAVAGFVCFFVSSITTILEAQWKESLWTIQQIFQRHTLILITSIIWPWCRSVNNSWIVHLRKRTWLQATAFRDEQNIKVVISNGEVVSQGLYVSE